jgi:hypothetical protein
VFGHTVIQRARDVAFSQLDDELLAIDVDQGHLYSMNETAGDVWAAISEPIAVDTLCAGLTARYAIDADTCRRDVVNLLEWLREAGLVVVRA